MSTGSPEGMHGGPLAAALVDWLETSTFGVRRLARDFENMRLRAEAAESRLQAAEKAWAAYTFGDGLSAIDHAHRGRCAAMRADRGGCDCGLSALAAALEARP